MGMQFGLSVFATRDTLDPGAIASGAEEAGCVSVLFADHTHIPLEHASPYPGGGVMPAYYADIYDPLIACAWAASSTTSVAVGIGVCLVPARDPIVLAKQVASLDVMAKGRMRLGVGAGWLAEEVADHGVEPERRWLVLDERVRAMIEIWSHDIASYESSDVVFAPMRSGPAPYRSPHPPILVGGAGPRVLERVVEYGDEWLAMVVPGAPPLTERIAELESRAQAAGRTRPQVSIQVYGWPPPEAVIERYVAAGVDRIDIGLPWASPEIQRQHLAELAELIARWN